MNEPVAGPMQKVEVGPLGTLLTRERLTTLIKTEGMEIIQLVIPAGRNVPTHQAQGEIVLHCLEGRVRLAVGGQEHELNAGQLLYLVVDEPFSVEAIENASLLATIILPREGANVELIGNSARSQPK